MRFFLQILLLSFLPAWGLAQDNPLVKQQADLFAQATFEGDYQTVIRYTYPRLVALSGGEEKMHQLITDRIETLKKQGALSFEGSVGMPGKFYQAGDELHCLLPEELVMTTSAGKYTGRTWLLGISGNDGKSWTFMDVGAMPHNVLLKLLPSYNNALVIPPPVKMEFSAN
ncbi:hypothetical protein DYU05_20160 [Mucilaginibacter terrenus]|uniref:DUF4251 domain-containing protein n=1 Tax=Mucilaginibacter terrenus TaxID=2482727 RepID=A0A3E2NJ94_9SPHI|nr:hypothetical protein [Mucilaginibacter terrenus]RFZ81076.1 hypothetical protein DYU05_20160 [Mucilaginibacter terrenus]